VPSKSDVSASGRQGFWPSIARIFLVEMVVLLALAAAVVAYVNWSSEVAWAEFLAASKLAVPAPNQPNQPNQPMQPVKGKGACDRHL
jgi:hypothetical protein